MKGRGVSYNAFANNPSLKEITIPSTYKESQYYGGNTIFEGCSSLEKIYVLSGLIPSLRGCYSLKELHLTGSVTSIEDTALKDCFDVTIYAPAGSYAETYAVEHGIPFVAE